MSNPQPDSYSVASGQPVYAGRFPAAGVTYENLIAEFMPHVPNHGTVPAMPDQLMQLDNSGGEREEIGLFTEWEAYYFALLGDPSATQAAKDTAKAYIIKQSTDLLIYDWWDVRTGPGDNQLVLHGTSVPSDSSHRPSLFFLAALLTNDESLRQQFIYALRGIVWAEQRYRLNTPSDKTQPNDNVHKALQQREWAWFMRDVARLAWLEDKGILTNSLLGGTEFRTLLANNLAHCLAEMDEPDMGQLGWLGTRTYEWMNGQTNRAGMVWSVCHWMQGYCAQVVGHIIKLGFTDWLPVAEHHMKFWNAITGSKWPISCFGGDYSPCEGLMENTFDKLGGTEATPQERLALQQAYDIYANIPLNDYPAVGSRWRNDAPDFLRADALTNYNSGAGWPDNLIPDEWIGGTRMTYAERTDNPMSGIAMYADVGVTGAATLLAELKSQRQARIDRSGMADFNSYRFSLEWEKPEGVTATWHEYPNTVIYSGLNDTSFFVLAEHQPPVSNVNGTIEVPIGNPSKILGAWGAGAYDRDNDVLYNHGGGHNDYYGNQIIKFDAVTGQYSYIYYASTDFTGYDPVNPPHMMPDGTRPSCHTYQGVEHVGGNTLWMMDGSLASDAGTLNRSSWQVDMSNPPITPAAWTRQYQGPFDGLGLGTFLLWHKDVDIRYCIRGGKLHVVDPVTGVPTMITSSIPPTMSASDSYGFAYDHTRGIILGIGRNNGAQSGNPRMRAFDCATGDYIVYRTGGPDPDPEDNVEYMDIPLDVDGPGIDYVPELDRFAAWGGGNTIYLIDPVTRSFTDTIEVDDSLVSAPSITGNGMFGRFRWSTNLKRFIVQTGFSVNVHYIQLEGV